MQPAEALVALRDSGATAIVDPAYQRGVQFLMKSRLEDGSWFVRSRAAAIQPYFESGFPRGHDQMDFVRGDQLGDHGVSGSGPIRAGHSSRSTRAGSTRIARRAGK